MLSCCWLVPWRCFSVVLCIAVGWCGIDSVFICSDFVCCALCYVVFSGIVDPWVFVFRKDAVGTDLRTNETTYLTNECIFRILSGGNKFGSSMLDGERCM